MTNLSTSFKNTIGLVRSDRPLTDAQLFQAAPSVFATTPHDSRSARYTYIATLDVVNALRAEGFMPFMACQSRSRIAGKTAFTKHLLRFRHQHPINGTIKGETQTKTSNNSVHETANEIILLNSHDGTSSYQMLAGCFRFVCHNGLIMGDTIEDFRVRHSGKVLDNIIEGAYRMVDKFEQIEAAKERMRGVKLTVTQQQAFAKAALPLRYHAEHHSQSQSQSHSHSPILAPQLNQARRVADQGNTLWHTFNRVQENLIQGGLQGINRNGHKTTTRKVTSLTENIRLNRALWTLAEDMATLSANG
jgi:hypothetical protein